MASDFEALPPRAACTSMPKRAKTEQSNGSWASSADCDSNSVPASSAYSLHQSKNHEPPGVRTQRPRATPSSMVSMKMEPNLNSASAASMTPCITYRKSTGERFDPWARPMSIRNVRTAWPTLTCAVKPCSMASTSRTSFGGMPSFSSTNASTPPSGRCLPVCRRHAAWSFTAATTVGSSASATCLPRSTESYALTRSRNAAQVPSPNSLRRCNTKRRLQEASRVPRPGEKPSCISRPCTVSASCSLTQTMSEMSLTSVSSSMSGRRLAGSCPSLRGFGMQLSLPRSQLGSGRSYTQNSWMAARRYSRLSSTSGRGGSFGSCPPSKARYASGGSPDRPGTVPVLVACSAAMSSLCVGGSARCHSVSRCGICARM